MAFLYSPGMASLKSLSEVGDELFREGLLGQGYALWPRGNMIKSPVTGRVSLITESYHAYGISTDNGAKVLVHFGLDTHKLKGKGIMPKVKIGDYVEVGDVLLEFDEELLRGHQLITPVVVTNINSFDYEIDLAAGEGAVVMKVCKKA